MKKTLFISAMLLMALASMAQQAVITFTTKEHDFGKINEGDGRVTTIFEFKNEGMAPLVLSNVRASCGCTTPKWTREPIEPGQTGNITVTYNPNGRPGKFQKTITVTSNASNPTEKLFIRGEVIPKTAKPVVKYTIKMGDLSLKANSLSFGDIKNTENKSMSIEYANLTDHDITVDLLLNSEYQGITPQVTLPTVKPNETGNFNINIDGAHNQWGPVQYNAYVKVNGNKSLTDEYKLVFDANIVEDFTKLTPEQRMNAPIVEMKANEINLGTIKAGKTASAKIQIKNGGVNPLMIRRIVNNATDCMKVTASKTTVKGGKTIELKADVSAMQKGKPMTPATYRKQVELITNDPSHSVIRVNIVWVVE